MATPGEWFSSLPPLTRLYGASCFAATLASQLGLVSHYALVLFWKPVFSELQLWRLLTCFVFLGKFSMNFCILVLWIFRYGVQLETNVYAGRGADYAWFLLSTMGILLASTALLPAVMLGPSLIMALVYVWSRANATARVSFFGLFAVEGFYLPFALLAWTLLSGGDAVADVRGILAGHVYYFLSSVWPRQGGPKLLETPQVVRAATAWAFGGAYAAPPTQRGAPPPPRGGVFQGRGRRLNE